MKNDKWNLTQYTELLNEFVKEKISAEQFEKQYLHLFKNDLTTHRPRKLFNILDKLFGDVDAFVAQDNLREAGDLNMEELIQEAKVALKELNQY